MKPRPADQSDAWLGDAVLELYVRSWILRERGVVDADMKTRFTCNQFLNCFGEPTKVEARIGRMFREHGIEAAFGWIRENIEPLFLKQEAKKKRQRRG
ncbi:MAG: hypothetical protein K1X78_20885 [Verrucomicrobiaceae bacterium]|nr:hypothetical protein [Verrucomicrobiaceae bacterium]